MGYLNGDLNNRGTLKQQEQIKKLSGMIQDIYLRAGLSKPLEKMPADYVVLGQDTEPMPPLTASAIQFKKDEPLNNIFEHVLSIQDKHLPDSVYGMLISLRQE